jgi:hypothetical protein
MGCIHGELGENYVGNQHRARRQIPAQVGQLAVLRALIGAEGSTVHRQIAFCLRHLESRVMQGGGREAGLGSPLQSPSQPFLHP